MGGSHKLHLYMKGILAQSGHVHRPTFSAIGRLRVVNSYCQGAQDSCPIVFGGGGDGWTAKHQLTSAHTGTYLTFRTNDRGTT